MSYTTSSKIPSLIPSCWADDVSLENTVTVIMETLSAPIQQIMNFLSTSYPGVPNTLTGINPLYALEQTSNFDLISYSPKRYEREWNKTYIEDKIISLLNENTDFSAITDSVMQDISSFISKASFNADKTILDIDEGVVTFQWRDANTGAMVIFTGDGSAAYSIKTAGGYYATSSREFALSNDIPQDLRNAIGTIIYN